MPPEVQHLPPHHTLVDEGGLHTSKEKTLYTRPIVDEDQDRPALSGTEREGPKVNIDVAAPGDDPLSGEGSSARFDDTIGDVNIMFQKLKQPQFEEFWRQLFNEEKKNGRLKTLSQVGVLHHNFTDFRIEDLERELKSLKSVVYKLDNELEPPHRKAKLPVHRHELQRLSQHHFQITSQSAKRHWTQQPALEVQIREAVASNRVDLETVVEPRMKGRRREQPTSNEPQDNEARTPERLRIRSQSLMSHLQEISRSNILSLLISVKVDETIFEGGVVFLRPFKFFVRNERLIRKSLEQLEVNAKAGPTTDGTCGTNGSKLEKGLQRDYDDTDLLEDLKLLVHQFLDVDLKHTFELCQMIDQGTALDIEYSDLWHLFSRGDIVILQSDQTHARRVVNFAGGREPLGRKVVEMNEERPYRVDGFVVDCLSYGSDGSAYVPKLEKISIKKYSGKRRITSLPVYPLRFDPKQAELRSKYFEVGRRLLNLTSHPYCHKLVQGKTLDEPSHELDAQVIVDLTLALSAKPEWRLGSGISPDDFTQRDTRETKQESWCWHSQEGCCGSDTIFKDFEYDELDSEMFAARSAGMWSPLQAKDLTDEDLMLMQPFVYAFVLSSRQWVKVWTSDLHEVVFENNFEDLVVPNEHKQAVRALVKTHENTRASHSSANIKPSIGSALDLVKGKGAGLIILLHGPPGVGKTSTAECVADDTKRPLYPITCGDIGETAAEVESSLQYNFRLAHKWGCVLLLDEADVFLAKRTRIDLRHNAVTSVFLRSLEYYAGILFLTSNRVGAIDPAFKSRIQMSLSYPKLDLSVTCKLYEKFIERTREEQKTTNTHHFKIRDREILAFAKRHYSRLEMENRETWNGRQIRNAFQTAIALVEYQYMSKDADESKPSLGKSQFKSVAQGSREFDDYLHSVLGSTEADTARREGWRDDGFMASSAPISMVPHAAAQRKQEVWSSHKKQVGKQVPLVSDSDDLSDSDTDEDETDEDDKRNKHQSLKTEPESAAAVETPSAGIVGGSSEMEQFQKFLKFKEMMAKQGA